MNICGTFSPHEAGQQLLNATSELLGLTIRLQRQERRTHAVLIRQISRDIHAATKCICFNPSEQYEKPARFVPIGLRMISSPLLLIRLMLAFNGSSLCQECSERPGISRPTTCQTFPQTDVVVTVALRTSIPVKEEQWRFVRSIDACTSRTTLLYPDRVCSLLLPPRPMKTATLKFSTSDTLRRQ